MAAKRRRLVTEDFDLGYGTTTIPTDTGGTRAATKFGAHSILGAFYNVKDFGAIGDGITDDTLSVQAAIDEISTSSHGTVFLPAGTYKISTKLTSTSRKVNIVGAGKDATILYVAATGIDGYGASNGSRMAHLTFRGPNATSSGNSLIDSGNVSDFILEDCIIEKSGESGINTGGSSARWIIRNNIIRQNKAQGIFLGQGTTDCIIEGNEVYSNDSIGIDVNGSRNIIRGNQVRSNGVSSAEEFGILIAAVTGNSDYNIVANNVVTDHKGPGILLTAATSYTSNYNQIIGNNVSAQTSANGDGILIGDGAAAGSYIGNQIIGNICQGNARHGICLDSSATTALSRTVINSNSCIGNTGTGLLVTGTDTLVGGNLVTGNTAAQITDSGTRTSLGPNRINLTDSYSTFNGLLSTGVITTAGMTSSASVSLSNTFAYQIKDSGGTARNVIEGLSADVVRVYPISANDIQVRNFANSASNLVIENDGTIAIPVSGLVVGAAPTGGDKGIGSINIAADIYKNNTAYTNPDYVFEHAYTSKIEKFAKNPGAAQYKGRKSIKATEAYARKHFRLPGVHQAKGMFQRSDVLLEKLEEAYLHIFELNARVEALERKK